MADKTRWGILGLGGIAKSFATGLQAIPDAELVAVGSRTQDKANAFGEEFKAPHRHGSYEALVGDPDVDAIYVASPHPMHKEHSLLCLDAGKAVLCEKPFTINAADTADLIAFAREKKLFLMEAMWTRFLPAIVKVREWLAAGAIGEPRMVTADFGFRAGVNPEGRLFNPALGGGGLLDVGVYTVAMAFMVFGGAPAELKALCHLGETGVDEQAALIGRWDAGQLALLSCAVRTGTPHEARIDGTDGRILIPNFWHTHKATLTAGETTETFDEPLVGNGYNYEAVEVMNCLRAGVLESDVMPLDETLAIAKTMDEARSQWGLKYPME